MQPTTPPSLDDLLTHASFVRAVARATVRGDADVDDVVQDTWLAAIENGPRHGGSPRGWLAAVARNAARGLKRGEGRRHDREARSARPEGVPSTAEIAAKEEVRRRLLEAVLGLDEPYRSAVLLRYYEDLPPREVAKRLGVPVETARTRVKRGLAQLRTRLDDRWDGDRRAWAVAVAPLAGAGLGGAAKAVGTGLAAKAAAAVLALGLLGGAGWYAIDRSQSSPVDPDPVELAAGEEEDAGPRLRPATSRTVHGAGTIQGTVRLDQGEGEVRVSAVRVGPLEMLDPRHMQVNPFQMMLSPPLGGDAASTSTVAADGGFRLQGLTKGLYLVAAHAPDGHAHIAPAFLLADGGEGEVALDLRRGPHALSGRVLGPDGTPAAGWVYLQHLPKGPMAGSTLTWSMGTEPRRLDADGGFRFEHLAAGTVALIVVQPGVRVLRQDALPVPAPKPLEVVLGAEARYRGRVVDAATGTGIAGADALLMVRLGGEASFLLSRARSDAEGRLRVPDVDREVDAFVRAEGYTPTQAEWNAGENDVTVRLDRTASIRGRVVDGSGQGLANVTVHARPLEGSGPFGAGLRATTDAKGAYGLDDVPAGEVMVFAHGGGYTSAQIAQVEARGFNPYVHTVEVGATIAVDLVAVPAGRIEGRLYGPNGKGMAGAHVHVVGEPWPDLRGPRLRMQELGNATDDDGTFRIDTVLPGESLQVVARRPDGGRVESERFALAEGQTHEVELTSEAVQRVTVRVTDESGTPVAGVRVLVVRLRADGGRIQTNAGRGYATDDQGHYLAGPVSASDVAITVKTKAFLRHEPVTITDAHRSGSEMLEIVLSRGVTIAGRVSGPQGLDLTTVVVDLERKGSVSKSIQADANGLFRFEVLPEGEYTVEASAGFDDHGWKAKQAIEDATQPVRLELARGKRLVKHPIAAETSRVTRWALHVRGPDGEAIPEAAHRQYVRFPGQPWHYSGYGRGREFQVQTHVSGTEEMYVEIFAAADERGRPLPLGAALVFPSDLPAGGGEHTVTLPREQIVRGRIVGPDGESVAGVPIEAFGDYGTHQLPIASHDPHAKTRSAADGAFTLRRLGPFAYVLRLDLPKAYAPQGDLSVHAGDEDVVIQLRASASARVQVLDEGGRTIPGAHVQLAHGNQTFAASLTDAQGLFVAGGLDPDLRYRVTARMPEGTSRYLITVLEEQAPGEIEVVLRSAQGVSGVVLDTEGRPLPWACVYRQTSESGWETHFADESGQFALEGLPGGDLVLMVSPRLVLRWFDGARHTVRTPASDLRLVAELGGGITYRLPDGVVPEEAAIVITDQEDPNRRASFYQQMIKQRIGTIYGLDPERRYALYAVANERVFHARDLQPGPEAVEIELQPWRTLTVRLDLPGGLPEGLGWENASVSAEGLGWRQHGRLVDPSGPTWEVPALPAGPCRVHARLERWARSSNDPSVPPERVGGRYEAVAKDVTRDEVRLTLREASD